ncbi:Transcription initiation factor TFIID subunit 8 [Caenorhabditis elegans]|uniref:Transcription initiation factor TFIID subunit 8 n=1 Tax=Caenorhabditis elegans TaxID=6239 RepID=Q8WQ97_CAEEL|nr:Transcription initiation factor TFIID subunit 8 [Caenorhabditis elegans]CAD18882.1 Transcription initiation factor TFIID subunit 8 [Caenorhabditis elegans]|eukprot:NP_001022513.1 TAF (TBP-associated transcription factor) family [Caenorhabditis elegans]
MLPQHNTFIRRPTIAGRSFHPSGYSVQQFVPQQSNFQQPISNFTQKSAESRAQKQVGANFLPSIVNEAYHNVLEQIVTAMCYKSGFDDIEEGALETLMLLFHSYIKRIGEQSRFACEVAGRTIVTPGDVWFGLVNMGIKVNQLSDFHQDQIISALTVHAPEIIPPEAKNQALRIGTPRPHPSYVYEWLPPLPDPHTYIKTEISEDIDFSYEKVREAMSQKKRNGITSLVNYMIRNYPSICLFRNFEEIIHEQVKKTFNKESEEKRMQEAFVAFRDLVQTNDIDEVKNVSKSLYDKGLISKHELQSGTEVLCMSSDGALIDQFGERVYLSETTSIDLEDKDRVSKSSTRMTTCGDGAESLRYHWPIDEMLDELIELDSCTMDLGDEKIDEMKYMQEKTTFEYLPEWCHILIPSFEHRAYLTVVSDDLKAEEESKKDKDKEKDKQIGDLTEEEKKGKDEEITHENLYLCPPIRDNDYGNYEDEEITEESALEVPEND